MIGKVVRRTVVPLNMMVAMIMLSCLEADDGPSMTQRDAPDPLGGDEQELDCSERVRSALRVTWGDLDAPLASDAPEVTVRAENGSDIAVELALVSHALVRGVPLALGAEAHTLAPGAAVELTISLAAVRAEDLQASPAQILVVLRTNGGQEIAAVAPPLYVHHTGEHYLFYPEALMREHFANGDLRHVLAGAGGDPNSEFVDGSAGIPGE